MVVYLAIVQGGIGAGQWLSFAPNMAQATAAANRILASRKAEREDAKRADAEKADGDSASNEDGDEDGGKGGARIEFSNVWFRSPSRDAPVLSGLDLTVSFSEAIYSSDLN